MIVLDDTGMEMRKPKDPEKFKEANKVFVAGLKQHAVTGEALPAYGTNVLANIINESGGYPTHNFKEGQFSGVSKISGQTEAELEENNGFANNPRARLQWFYERSRFNDRRYLLYPIGIER